ncbi:MAG TPA: hypothetical protein VK154_06855 [Chitinophagales bacterium]|nr:hypothetical protein [Chitinophagales bacterium]
MKKQWLKTTDFNYTFLVDGKEAGKMQIEFDTSAMKANCTINGKALEIKRTGFWKSNLEITDGNGQVVLKTYPEKWYASTSIIDFENKKLRLSVRNNPLAEFAIKEDANTILSYGLTTEGKEPGVKISSTASTDYILDFLLWYLFVPVAAENLGDDYSFLLLLAS